MSPCLTPGAIYHIHDSPGKVTIAVDLPSGVSLDKDHHDLLHDGAQLAVAAALAAEGKQTCSSLAAHIVTARLLNAFPLEDD